MMTFVQFSEEQNLEFLKNMSSENLRKLLYLTNGTLELLVGKKGLRTLCTQNYLT
jgi:hypothetical protein